MQKINIKPIRSRVTEEYREELVKSYLEKAWVKNFLKEFDLDKNYVFENLGLFTRIEEENEPCNNCPGYEKCTKYTKGYKTYLDPYQNEAFYKSCDEKQLYDNLMNSYVRRDFMSNWIYADFRKDLVNNIYRKGVTMQLLDILTGSSSKGIYLHGKGDSGKSYIMAAFCNEMIRSNSLKVAFTNVSDFLQDLKKQFNTPTNNVDEMVEQLKTVDLLVLDDIGGETSSAWSISEILLKIIDYRNHNNLLTCYTSQLTLSELEDEYKRKSSKANRLIQKIRAYSKEVELKGVSLL